MVDDRERVRRIVAHRLQVARERAGYTQKSAAQAVGVSAHTMYLYERTIGGTVQPLHRLVALAALYRVSLDDLAGTRSAVHQTLLRARAVDAELGTRLAEERTRPLKPAVVPPSKKHG
jgi:DNA-binding XRE family transcriptional regulator